jgi:hypothetical protein
VRDKRLLPDTQLPADTPSYSIASGCPPHFSDRALAAEQANWLISLPYPLPGDYRLAATFEYEELSRKVPIRVTADGLDSLQDSVTRRSIKPANWEIEVTNRLQAIEAWCQRWSIIAGKFAWLGSISTDLPRYPGRRVWYFLDVDKYFGQLSLGKACGKHCVSAGRPSRARCLSRPAQTYIPSW